MVWDEPKQACVGRPTLRPLSFLLSRRFLSQNRRPLLRNLLRRESNIRQHRMDFAAARDRFEWADAVVEPAKPAQDGRPRFLAVGFLDGQPVSLVFAPVGSKAISAISLRRASRVERSRDDQA